MKKTFRLFLFLLSVLIVPVLCQASTTILSNASPNHTITSGSDEKVYGTSASNIIILESGAKVELINFPGQNNIQIQSSSEHFTVFRSGTVVTFQGSEDTVLKIPSTTDIQTITFSDRAPLTFSLYNNQVMLDDKMIGTTPANIGTGHVIPDEENDFELILEGSEDNVVSVFPGDDLELKISAVPLSLDEGEDASFTYQIVASDLPTATINNDGNITAHVPDDFTAGTTLHLTVRVHDATMQIEKDLVASIYVMAQTIVASNVLDSQGGTVSDPTNSVKVEVPPGALDIPAQIDILVGEAADGRQVIRFWTDSESSGEVNIYLPPLSEEKNIQAFLTADSSVKSNQLQDNDSYWNVNEIEPQIIDEAYYIGHEYVLGSYRLPGDSSFNDSRFYRLSMSILNKFRFYRTQVFRIMTGQDESNFRQNNIEPVLFIHGYQKLGAYGGGRKYWGNFPDLMEQLEINGKKFISFDFQWRADARFQDAAKDLVESIKKIYSLTGNKKIHIIAHSFGGVLARCALQGVYENSGTVTPTDYIASLISFGSPYSGIFNSDTYRTTILFPDGQHEGSIDPIQFAKALTVYQMGEDISFGVLEPYLDIDDTPGEIAWHLADTILRIPSDFPMTIGISSIAEPKTDWYPKVEFSEGDGLISFQGQRFYPELYNQVLLSSNEGNQVINGHALNVTEVILGFKDDVVPLPNYGYDIWDLTNYTSTEIENSSDLSNALKNHLNYKHSGSFTMASGKWANSIQAYVNCNDVNSCNHEAFSHTQKHLSRILGKSAPPSGECGAYVAPNVWKEFDCYNLAAIGKTTNDDPFTPSWRLIGGYWQWGRKGPSSSQWYDTNTPNFAHGPTGPGSGEANEGEISGWDIYNEAPDEAWSDDYKTANDPCPDGYRVPTISHWERVIENNTPRAVGTWSTSSNDPTNYSSARFFGNDLMLPVPGSRTTRGGLKYRGLGSLYQSSSSGNDSRSIGCLNIEQNHFRAGFAWWRTWGIPVRCIKE